VALLAGAVALALTGCAGGSGPTPAAPAPSTASPGTAAAGDAESLPAGFSGDFAANGPVRVHYVTGGHGPALVLLHGWPETWYAWAKMMPKLAESYTVVAVDLRGLGDSGPAPTDAGNYTADALAGDVQAVLDKMGQHQINLAGHDWGGNVALSFAAEHRDEVRKLIVLEAPPTTDYLHLVAQYPNLFWWDSLFNGAGGDLPEQLIAGRERTFYSSIFANSGGAIDAAEVDRYVADYSRPGSTHAGMEYFRQQDVGETQADQLIARQGKLPMPVLGVGAEHSMGALVGAELPRIAATVTSAVVPGTNHWLLDEAPDAVTTLITNFLRQ